MQKIICISFLLITFSCFSQKASWLRGRIIADTLALEPINIVNLTKEIGTINNDLGYFAIEANPGDSIVFSSVRFRSKKIIVDNSDLQSDDFKIFLELAVNELAEVRISQYSLSGEVKKDIEEIPTYEDRLPLWSAADIKRMRLTWANDAQSPVENIALGNGNNLATVSMDLSLLINMISGVFGKKSKEINSKIKITDVYKEEFFIKELKIPETQFYNFLDFLKEETDLEPVLKTKDRLKILQFLMNQSKIFRQKYKVNE
ncbi:hypothetical protein [uncultured Aquimarina sp.]|uniref:hypothetical protein n=1 Tax=uncultured Aquimarina sp. TaxID=575652 RepID=UPI002636684A|nr:hypothetical protein [uncultured Aquimarina sp.]